MYCRFIKKPIRQYVHFGVPGIRLYKRIALVISIFLFGFNIACAQVYKKPAQPFESTSLLSSAETAEKLKLQHAQQAADLHQVLNSYLSLSTIYSKQGNAQAIIDQNKKAIALARQLNNKQTEANLLTDSGSAWGELGNIKEDIRHQFAAKALYEQLGNQEGIAATLNNIAASYADMGNHEKFLEYQNKSLEISKKQNLYAGVALSLLNLGQHYKEVEKNNVEALEYFMQALDILEAHAKKPAIYYAFSLASIASSHFLLHDAKAAKTYNNKLRQVAEAHGFQKSLIDVAILDAELFLEAQQLQLAHQSLDRAEHLAEKLQIDAKKMQIYRIRADIYTLQQNYKQALHYHDMYAKRRISELEDENRHQILVSQAWFDDQEKQKTLDQLQRQKVEQNLMLKEQLFTERALSAGILAVTFVVLILLILIYQARKSHMSAVKESQSLSHAVKKAEQDARQDALTGLLNRRGFMELLEHEYLQMKYRHTELTLILADIDHFKRINDSYGHECGDKALKKIAAFLKHNIRERDFISRWGGEEFLIMMPNTGSEAATHLTERIRKKLSETIIGCESHQIALTMTFGISQCTSYETVKHCISRADNALYEGKASGRNTVTVILP